MSCKRRKKKREEIDGARDRKDRRSRRSSLTLQTETVCEELFLELELVSRAAKRNGYLTPTDSVYSDSI